MSSDGTLRASMRNATLSLCVLACATVPLARAQPTAPSPTPLREGEPRSVTQHAADRFSYEVEVGAAGAYLIAVEQRGLDLIVSIAAPNGAPQWYNSPAFRDGSELVVLDAPAAGKYRVDVRCDEATGAPGGHTASVKRLPPGTDPRELDAWRLVSSAGAANFAADEPSWARAADSYGRAADLWHALGRAREEADALFAAATVEYWQLYTWDQSAGLAQRAAALYDTQGEAALAANAIHLRAAALIEQALETKQSATAAEASPESDALFAEALRLLEQARRVHERLGNVYDLGLVVNNLGYAYHSKGDSVRAHDYFVRAAALFRSVDEHSGEIKSLSNAAALDAEAGQLVSAIATFERILALLPPGAEQRRRTITLDNLGASQLLLGDTERALRTFAAALELQRELDDAQGEGRSLRRIGETYYTLGEVDLAEQYLGQALPVAVRTNDGRGQEAALRNLGNAAFLRRGYDEALDFHRRALEIAASVSDRAHLQLLIAKDLLALGRGGEAQAAAAQAESVAASTGSELLHAGALLASGRARLPGEPAVASADLGRAAAIYERVGMRAEHAETLHWQSRAAQAAGDFDEAVRFGAAALREVEQLRARLAAPELRALFAAARQDYYETQIGLLMSGAARAGTAAGARTRAALAVSEQGRARMVADLLQEAAVDLRHGFDPTLEAKQQSLYGQLAERRHQRDLLLGRPAAERSTGDVERVVADLTSLENELNLTEIELRRGSSSFARLTQPAILTPAEMQAMLDPDTVLLQYALGSDASYAWAVTHDGVAAIELADRATIEAAVKRALAGLKSYTPGTAPAPPGEELAELASLALAPAAEHLGHRRIVLALDGALQYVPFGVLPVRRADGSLGPLLETHEVVEVPSLSALTLASRGTAAGPRKTLAVFADPVLQPSDPRLGSLRPGAVPADYTVAARSSVGAELGRLLSTSYEAEAIAALVPDAGRLLARGFDASRAAVLDTQLQDFRYIHFATHGLIDSRYPGLSALVLSQFDGAGKPQDGFLRLNDIYNLRLNADLVVLSACDTALGRDVRGEGLIGLTQGFMSAGARSLIASLWQVPDRATAELMKQFYGYLLDEGLRPAEALRKAQAWSAAQPRFRDPYFWGGFVLVGDWR